MYNGLRIKSSVWIGLLSCWAAGLSVLISCGTLSSLKLVGGGRGKRRNGKTGFAKMCTNNSTPFRFGTPSSAPNVLHRRPKRGQRPRTCSTVSPASTSHTGVLSSASDAAVSVAILVRRLIVQSQSVLTSRADITLLWWNFTYMPYPYYPCMHIARVYGQ